MASVSSGAERMDPDLTPLLDVVMQLIMFFMMCINFVNEQVNANVQLPTSSSAQELPPKSETEVLIINIVVERQDKKDAAGQVLLDKRGAPVREVKWYPWPTPDQPDRTQRKTRIIFVGQKEIEFLEDVEGTGLSKTQTALVSLAKSRKDDIKRRFPKKFQGVPADKITLEESVVIRADTETRYGIVVRLMAQCVQQGFPKIQFRANQAKD